MSYATHICTWLYAEPEGEESLYPQVTGTSSTLAFQAVYWRCVVVFFATSLRHNPDARHTLFTNTPHLPTIDGFDVAAFFDRHGIEHVQVAFTYQPPPGYHHEWRNQFYVLDLIKQMAQRASPNDALVLLDSDCVWIERAERMRKALNRYGLLTYDMGYPEDFNINGLSRLEMKEVFEDIEEKPLDKVPAYFGGEFFAALGTEATRLVAHFGPLWEVQRRRFAAGQKKFNEEAHFLSFLYHLFGYAGGTANPFIRRIWTGFSYHNIEPEDVTLTVWHLPSEKQTGIKWLFDQVTDPADSFWQLPVGEQLRQYLGGFLGIPHRTAGKWFRDVAQGVRRKAGGLLAK